MVPLLPEADMTDFAAAAREELELVRAELASHPAFQKYERLQALVAVYPTDARPAAEVSHPASPSRFTRSVEPQRTKRGINPDRDFTLKLAAEAIEGRYTPTRTSEIYDLIAPLGAKIGGTEPKGNLSAMLHHSDLFTSHGRKGWTLAELDNMVELLGTGEPQYQSSPSSQADEEEQNPDYF